MVVCLPQKSLTVNFAHAPYIVHRLLYEKIKGSLLITPFDIMHVCQEQGAYLTLPAATILFFHLLSFHISEHKEPIIAQTFLESHSSVNPVYIFKVWRTSLYVYIATT
jgi:hypothetical protein